MNYYGQKINVPAMKTKHITIIIIASLLVVFLFLGVLGAYGQKSNQVLQKNLYYGDINISGLSYEAAIEKITRRTQGMEEQGLKLSYADTKLELPAIAVSFDTDLAYQYFRYNTDELANKLKPYGQANFVGQLWQQLSQRQAEVINPDFKLDEEKIKSLVSESFPESYKPATDAVFIFNNNQVDIAPEIPGKTVNWKELFVDIYNRLSTFSSADIKVKTQTEYPTIYASDLKGLNEEAKRLSATSLVLTYKDKEWSPERSDIIAWLAASRNDKQLSLYFRLENIAKYLIEKIAPEINVAPEDPRFEIKDNKISSWQLGKDGYELDITASAEKIINDYKQASTSTKIELIIKVTPPAEAESFDIREIIGTGHSNFAGSSKSRRHNISVGAAAVHGLVIKPGEEFSLMGALGEIDEHSGYLPELVIKNNKTIPEYGGGLCQIGTTVFRTALASGLPITARQNHSYRVSYYEPAGTDATIYDPWPDLRFINDTGKNILIQSRIDKDDVYFDFWGTKDGRVATTTYPVIYNIVKPAPTKIVETDDLKPGEKKCTEKPHNGADAYFDYTVIYPEGSTSTPLEQTRRFQSHYVPWQEVCLVGKTPSATSTPAAASSTPETSSNVSTTTTSTE